MSKHALLSASSSHRWLSCPPLPRLESFFQNEISDAAIEGTLAHKLAEYKLRVVLKEEVAPLNMKKFNQEMQEHTDDYVSYILEQVELEKQTTKDVVVLIEQRLDFSHYVPEGFGTGDCIIISDKNLHIIDFKYGQGVEVSAENNPQMMLYGLGALNIYDALYDIETVKMTIFQPRKYNISTFELGVDKLTTWAETELKEKAEAAFEGKGVITYGPWCQFSSCGAVLRARFDHHKKLERFELKSPYLLTDSEIEEVLDHIDDLVKWSNEVKEYATKLALQSGKEWSGYKLVHGRSTRKFKDEETVVAIAKENGYDNIYKQSLLSMTELQKLMGKTKFETLFKEQLVKQLGKPTLVTLTDKRQAIVNAKQEFNEIKEEN
ncbi:DUF2800 domain-containing protein [Streptococcus agalactiae]|uniref:DUF2800 domain-containing protein n=1 Tax=Helcococcus bovis TaxID=3153252 RepID=A0ABW9F6Z1_9FIRM|nr:DUF2800 domain-containing protein [Streptococcus agalactiae]HEM2695147.1 DUF2800 domain-containing protein [Streptococcus suis]KAF1268400.1 nuclease [Streptococcus agalactiae]RRA51972.1 DUF2800 domain-containing protein [Streptococcus agalactiae]HEM2709470.1 DUF2800 domain-containing protein [Streptococcus suis]HEM2732154.1 DUF2800 domain-containing protein [Streptococcus suis]